MYEYLDGKVINIRWVTSWEKILRVRCLTLSWVVTMPMALGINLAVRAFVISTMDWTGMRIYRQQRLYSKTYTQLIRAMERRRHQKTRATIFHCNNLLWLSFNMTRSQWNQEHWIIVLAFYDMREWVQRYKRCLRGSLLYNYIKREKQTSKGVGLAVTCLLCLYCNWPLILYSAFLIMSL